VEAIKASTILNPSPKRHKATLRSRLVGNYRVVCLAVAAFLLYLSLDHLTEGVRQTTGSTPVQALFMTIGIDCSLIPFEIAAFAGVRTRWTMGLLAAVLAISAGFNVLGFLQHSQGVLGQSLAVVLGCLVPTTIYGLIDT
jgi:hypothetical protein